MEKPEIKSITNYVRDSHFDSFMKGEYQDVVWTLREADPNTIVYFAFKQVEVQISVDTYQHLLDIKVEDVAQTKLPF
jgi:hypothetical protein